MSALHDIRSRCTNPNHKFYGRYGGRGIKVCPTWLGYGSVHQFNEDMGPKPGPEYTVDRIDNDGDYTPSNTRWATPTEQQENSAQARAITLQAPDGALVSFKTRASAARAMGLGTSRGKLYDLLTGRRNHVRGWKIAI